MTPIIEQQIAVLKELYPEASTTLMPTGAHLISIPKVKLPNGWNRALATILFVAPPGYPAAQPDCFWVEPGGLRLENNGTPQNTNDSNPIPGDNCSRNTTWFSWHLQSWNPNNDSLVTYLKVIMKRLDPPR